MEGKGMGSLKLMDMTQKHSHDHHSICFLILSVMKKRRFNEPHEAATDCGFYPTNTAAATFSWDSGKLLRTKSLTSMKMKTMATLMLKMPNVPTVVRCCVCIGILVRQILYVLPFIQTFMGQHCLALALGLLNFP